MTHSLSVDTRLHLLDFKRIDKSENFSINYKLISLPKFYSVLPNNTQTTSEDFDEYNKEK